MARKTRRMVLAKKEDGGSTEGNTRREERGRNGRGERDKKTHRNTSQHIAKERMRKRVTVPTHLIFHTAIAAGNDNCPPKMVEIEAREVKTRRMICIEPATVLGGSKKDDQ